MNTTFLLPTDLMLTKLGLFSTHDQATLADCITVTRAVWHSGGPMVLINEVTYAEPG